MRKLVYLQEKQRVRETSLRHLLDTLAAPGSPSELPLSAEVVESMLHVPRSIVPDMPDRIIAATALHLGVPLVTADEQIRSLPNLQTIW